MMSQMMGSMQMPQMGMTLDMDRMQECIEACSAAAQAATMCADACAGMGGEMARCSAMCANTADMATTMMRAMLRPNGYDMTSMQGMLQGCMAMGMACAEECRRHADMHDHCRICAAACDQMVEACRNMMSGMGMPDAGGDQDRSADGSRMGM
jgi:hypothetical protein